MVVVAQDTRSPRLYHLLPTDSMHNGLGYFGKLKYSSRSRMSEPQANPFCRARRLRFLERPGRKIYATLAIATRATQAVVLQSRADPGPGRTAIIRVDKMAHSRDNDYWVIRWRARDAAEVTTSPNRTRRHGWGSSHTTDSSSHLHSMRLDLLPKHL